VESLSDGLVKAGYITEEEAPTYPGGNLVTRAIGLEPELKVDAPEETKKEDNEDNEDEIEDMKSFQDCVSQKIPKLIDEGMGQEQAIAVAIEMCSDGKKVKPPRESYEKWFKIAAQGRKQADQENVEDNPTAIAAGNTEAENDDFGSPQLDAMRQTNVLLGALINQMQLLNAKFDALSPKSEEKEESYDSEALQDESKDQKSIQTNSGSASLSQEHQTIQRFFYVLEFLTILVAL